MKKIIFDVDRRMLLERYAGKAPMVRNIQDGLSCGTTLDLGWKAYAWQS